MIAIERYINAKIYLNDIYYDKIRLTLLDNESQFLKLNLSNLSNLSDYKMFVYFILPFPLQNIVAEEVEEITNEVIITIPKTALIVTGELKIEIAFYNKITYQYLTIPKRMKLEIVETINGENPESVIPGESILTSIVDLIDKIDNICTEKISETETELLVLLTRLKKELSEYQVSLSNNLKEVNNDLLKSSLAELNSFLFISKEDLNNFINSNKVSISDNIKQSIDEISTLFETKKNELLSLSKSLSSNLNSQQEKIINSINDLKSKSISEINDTLEDVILKIGTNDDSMYNQYTPSIRKEAVDAVKKQKFEIIEETRKEIKSKIEEHISNLREQKFTIDIKPYVTKITLPINFILNGLTKVFSNGHLLNYMKDYYFDIQGTNIIYLTKESSISQTIVVTETLAQGISPTFSEYTWENVPYSTVVRDENGSFSVTSINGNLNGNASTSDKLKTPVKINGVEFDGSKDIDISQINLEIASEEEIEAIFKN